MKIQSPKNLPQQHLIDDDVARASDQAAKLPRRDEKEEKLSGLPDAIQWGEPPTDAGGPVAALAPEDEDSAAEQLILGGAEKAESSRRKPAEIGRFDQTRL